MTIKAVVFDAYGTLYDIQSVAEVTEEAFPGYGEIITQIWRIKQLEYTWLRSLMRRYQDFSVVTRRLARLHAAHASGSNMTSAAFERIMDKYLHLDLYPDALGGAGSDEGQKARDPLQRQPRHAERAGGNSGLDRMLDATISVDAKKIFKPSPEAYTLIESALRCRRREVLFISSNPWDACGAKAFGLNVAWIERVTPEAMALACLESDSWRR